MSFGHLNNPRYQGIPMPPENAELSTLLSVANGRTRAANERADRWELAAANTNERYEELRQVIDGGPESMTHDDAVQELRTFRGVLVTVAGQVRAAKADTEACNTAWYQKSLELHERIDEGIMALYAARERYESLSMAHGDTMRKLEDVTTTLTDAKKEIGRLEKNVYATGKVLGLMKKDESTRQFSITDQAIATLDSHVWNTFVTAFWAIRAARGEAVEFARADESERL